MKGWLIDGGDEWLRDARRSIISGSTSRELPTARASKRDFAREVTSANSSSGPSRFPPPSLLHPPPLLVQASCASFYSLPPSHPPSISIPSSLLVLTNFQASLGLTVYVIKVLLLSGTSNQESFLSIFKIMSLKWSHSQPR